MYSALEHQISSSNGFQGGLVCPKRKESLVGLYRDNSHMILKKFTRSQISVDVEKILNNLNIPYQTTSRDYVIRCISGKHVDNNPSLKIDKDKGVFKCWSCGFSGNMVVLVAKFLGVSNKESAKKLVASGYGKEIVKDAYSKGLELRKGKNKTDTKDDVITLPNIFIKLDSSHEMFLSYLYNRQVSWDMINEFDIRGCLVGYYNYRIIVPVYKKGFVVGFVARDILKEEERFERGANDYKKYLYPKGCSIGNYLFNYDDLDYKKDLFVVEGVFDFFALWYQGYRNSTCVFGLHITDKQANLLKRFKRIVVIPDQKGGAPVTLTEVVRDKVGGNVMEVVLPQGYDANDIGNLKDYIDAVISVEISPRISIDCSNLKGKKEILIKKNNFYY